jgi:hypothetical protein
LVFGDADDVEAMGAETAIALAVPAEGSLGAVGFEAVELADEARLGPEAIDLVTVFSDLEPSVEPRAWDAMGVEEGEKDFLERAPNPSAGVVAQAFETDADDRRPLVAWIPIEKDRQREGPVDPEVFDLPKRRLRTALAFLRREVQHRPSRRRHRNPLDPRDLVPRQDSKVPANRLI